MKQQLEPGDVVQLRSGSHPMTVLDVVADEVNVVWLDKPGEFKTEKLLAPALMYLPDHPGNVK